MLPWLFNATWKKGEQTTRETDRKCVFAVFSIHDFRSSRSRDVQTHKSKLMCKLRLEACKGFSGGRWCGRGWLQVMSHFFIAWESGLELILLPKLKFIHRLRSRRRAFVVRLSIELKHMRWRSALPFTGCLTFPEAWRNKTPDRIIDKTENYPNFSSRSFSANFSSIKKSLRFSCRLFSCLPYFLVMRCHHLDLSREGAEWLRNDKRNVLFDFHRQKKAGLEIKPFLTQLPAGK